VLRRKRLTAIAGLVTASRVYDTAMVRVLYAVCVHLLLAQLTWCERSLTAHAQKMVPDEQRLIRKLMRGYDTSARPVFNASQNVVVNFGLTLIQIIDMVRASAL